MVAAQGLPAVGKEVGMEFVDGWVGLTVIGSLMAKPNFSPIHYLHGTLLLGVVVPHTLPLPEVTQAAICNGPEAAIDSNLLTHKFSTL